jgi:hypothetical protein
MAKIDNKCFSTISCFSEMTGNTCHYHPAPKKKKKITRNKAIQTFKMLAFYTGIKLKPCFHNYRRLFL